MKKISLLLLVFVMISCKSEQKKNDTNADKIMEEVIQEQIQKPEYPQLTDVPTQLNLIFDNGYEFDENIKITYIALQKKDNDNYQLIYGLDAATDLEKVETFKISAVFYPEDPSLLKDEIYRKRKSRQVPAVCKVLMLENEEVVTQYFQIKPKEFSQIKFYFYNNQGVLNDKILTVRDVKMPQ